MSYKLTTKQFNKHVERVKSYMDWHYGVAINLVGKKEKKELIGISLIGLDGIYYPNTRTIYIDTTRGKPIDHLITLLHECGHARLMSRLKHNYHVLYSNSYSRDTKEIKSKFGKVDNVREEIAAWDEGYALNKLFYINIPWKIYGDHFRKTIGFVIESLSTNGKW